MKFLAGKKEDFINFLNSIDKKDNVAVISHNDLDGIASAILIGEILRQKEKKIQFFNLMEYKRGMFRELSGKLNRKITKIFVFDISIDSDYEGFKEIKKNFEVFLIDHHPSEIKENNSIKTKTEDCATYTLYELAKEIFDLSKLDWLVCATMISEFSYKDESNFQFIKNFYPEITAENINDSEPGEISKKISSSLIYFKRKEKKVFDLVAKKDIKKMEKYYGIIEKEVRKCIEDFKKRAEFYPDKNLFFYHSNPKFNIGSIVTTLLSKEEEDKTFVFVSDIKDDSGFVKVSARNQGGKEDINSMLRKGINGLENANAGGHFKASGARFMKKDLERFKRNILMVE